MDSSNVANKRQEERFPTNIPVKMKIINGTNWSEGKLTNLSKNGACLEGLFSRKIGTTIEVILPNIANYTILANVVWTNGGKTGLRFIFTS
jgi:hypothetical protein